MDRADDIHLPPDTPWLIDPHAQQVCALITAAGHQALFVGGCVRNALLGEAASDVDISTDALPEEVMTLAQNAGLKALPTGIDHGTVTVIAQGTPFEITTFRRDVATDGRRAVVAFSKDIVDDAKRRDFTMNALYATAQGHVIDPLGGLPDLQARRVRFIEDPHARIQEDFLRILRFFRFFAYYGEEAEGFDPDALDAITQNTTGLETLSAERIGQEMRKLLAAHNPAFALAGMRSTGALPTILPGADDRWVGMIAHMEASLNVQPNWITRLTALGGVDVLERLRLSKADARKLEQSREAAYGPQPLPEVAYRHGLDVAHTALMIRTAMAEQMADPDALPLIAQAAVATFPVSAADLMPAFQGAALGQRLEELKAEWIASGFTLEKSELLNHG